ncbi:3456_t:CDS:1, partial [Racocetra fulgida]
KDKIHDYQKQDSITPINILHNGNESLDKKLVEELCKLHEKEISKGSYDSEFINSIEEYLAKNQI